MLLLIYLTKTGIVNKITKGTVALGHQAIKSFSQNVCNMRDTLCNSSCRSFAIISFVLNRKYWWMDGDLYNTFLAFPHLCIYFSHRIMCVTCRIFHILCFSFEISHENLKCLIWVSKSLNCSFKELSVNVQNSKKFICFFFLKSLFIKFFTAFKIFCDLIGYNF